MAVDMQDVGSALAELGRLRFGEMKVEDAMHEIVRSTHAIFDVDGAGLMLADADHHLHNVAVAVLSEDRHPWSPEGELALLAFTDLAALMIASMMQGQEQSELAAQLQTALNSRAIIEQAKGVLIGQQGLSAHEAYEQLRTQARSQRRKLTAVSADVVRNAAGHR